MRELWVVRRQYRMVDVIGVSEADVYEVRLLSFIARSVVHARIVGKSQTAQPEVPMNRSRLPSPLDLNDPDNPGKRLCLPAPRVLTFRVVAL
jgi:hypothetical protein